ncbi:calcium-binding protein [Anabaena catenula]|uniref:Uncharacterized protein n=1 Tax=Anabaena catenula FACHB-362 TaxID=2692877 RepID=A0ABR8IZX1_9NOST|nr:calcium-binding protein [Anabaena catenula]MBD2691626.1 hypothetical protein [Anabaena catenula FACHB-362]
MAIIGDSTNNFLVGTDVNDEIFGLEGNDTILSSLGNDTLDGGLGTDTADYSNLNQSITLLPTGILKKSGGSTDQLVKIEKIIANSSVGNNTIDTSSAGAGVSINVNLGTQSLTVNGVPGVGSFTVVNFDDVKGTNANDTITGDSQNNQLFGNGGNDYLDGGLGNDTMNGGLGNDIYVVDSIGDVVKETSTLAAEIDDVYSSISYTLGANVENLTLIGTVAINGTGNALNNSLRGNTANNTLNGGDGNDVFFSLAGDDIIHAGNGDDKAFGGTGNDTIKGEVGNDVLYGEDGNDTLDGGAGNDFLDGGLGNDTMNGGLGDDIYVVDSIGDVVKETSTLATEIDQVQSSVSYTLGANVENLTLIGTGNINGTGNSLNNSITGNASNNTLNGLDGDDVFFSLAGDDIINAGNGNDKAFGGTGNDTIKGEVGNDVLYGEDGNDTISGGDGNDFLDGGAANDTLSGGAGGDNLTGGLGADRFVYPDLKNSLLAALDRIIDFNPSQGDRIVVNSLPTALFNAGVFSTANYSTLSAAAIAAYQDANPNIAGTQSLAAKQSVFFGWNGGTYLSVNDSLAAFNSSSDLLINLTGITGTVATGLLTTNNYFSV